MIRKHKSGVGAVLAALGLLVSPVSGYAETLVGRVTGGGKPVVNSTVTLLAAGTTGAKQLAQARSDANGRFSLTAAKISGTARAFI